MASIVDEDVEKPAVGMSNMVKARLVLGSMFLASLLALFMVVIFGSGATEVATFSVELASFQGLNATLGNVVSPTFSLKVRVENPRDLQPWCSNGGKVVVSYSSVALAWGDMPGFCVRRKAATDLVLLLWGKGVGLTEGLRRRLASELFAGTAQVLVEMKLFNDANDWSPSETYSGMSLQSFQLTLRAGSRA
ncbi:unnamed protein product [Urochloa humidicola]